jgi:NAD(P)-dependent dehydrogenase (short-subunit alcohol dehydrogenase family)
MSTQDSMTGRTVLVTGANRGLGQALVEEALRRGAKRVYAGSRQPITHPDARVTPLTLDITDQEQVAAAAEHVGELDVLVNNAGYAGFAGLDDREELAHHLEVNLYGPYNVTHAFRTHLTASRGTLVNVLSVASLAPIPMIPGYSISKAAAFSFTQTARMLFAASGVKVHAVLPGPLDTDMAASLDVPKATPADAAAAIFDGVAAGDDEIFPDVMAQAFFADSWSAGPVKKLERENAALLDGTDAASSTTTDTAIAPGLQIGLVVDQSPADVYAAILDVPSWWSGDFEGTTDVVGGVFTYRQGDVHRSTHQVTELAPGRRVAWHVIGAHVAFAADPTEWEGTDITFDLIPAGNGTEIRFTHVGLVRERECFESCSEAWHYYIGESLRDRILSGVKV